jgi:hypothetical protein
MLRSSLLLAILALVSLSSCTLYRAGVTRADCERQFGPCAFSLPAQPVNVTPPAVSIVDSGRVVQLLDAYASLRARAYADSIASSDQLAFHLTRASTAQDSAEAYRSALLRESARRKSLESKQHSLRLQLQSLSLCDSSGQLCARVELQPNGQPWLRLLSKPSPISILPQVAPCPPTPVCPDQTLERLALAALLVALIVSVYFLTRSPKPTP